MTKLEKFVITFLTLTVILLTGVLVWLLLTKWKQPLGPSLGTSVVTPFALPPTWTPDPSLPLSATDPVSTQGAWSTSGGSPSCDGNSPMYILVIGSDARADSYNYGLADVIRLVRMDFVALKITVLEFPRDLWVEIPDIADNLNGQDHEKLNQAYLYGNRGFGYTNDPALGPGLLARTLTLNFGTQIDHYAAVNMRTFEKIVNAVEGIDVTLPETVDGRTVDDTDKRLLFIEGTHHLNGKEALTLARIRIGGVFSRADNQDRVLCALRNKLTSADVLSRFPDIIQSFKGAVQTSLSPADLGQLACLSTKIEPQNIIFTSFPKQLFKQDRTYDPVFKKNVFTWNVDYDILREYIQRFNSGEWPYAVVAHTEQQEGDSFFCK